MRKNSDFPRDLLISLHLTCVLQWSDGLKKAERNLITKAFPEEEFLPVCIS